MYNLPLIYWFFRVIKPEESFIKPSDLVYENDSAISKGTEEEPLEKYAKNLCEKLDSKEISTDCITQAKFLPHKTLNTLSSNKKELRKPKSYWEVTAATPPTAVHGDTKMVTLQESIKLQREQQQQLKVHFVIYMFIAMGRNYIKLHNILIDSSHAVVVKFLIWYINWC